MDRHIVGISNVGNGCREVPEGNSQQGGVIAEKAAVELPPEMVKKHEAFLAHMTRARDSLLELGAAEDVQMLDKISSRLKRQ